MDFANSINTPLDIETLKVVSQEIDNKGEITINVLSRKGQNFVISAENPRQNPMEQHLREWFAIFLFLAKLFIFELLQSDIPVMIAIIILQQQSNMTGVKDMPL